MNFLVDRSDAIFSQKWQVIIPTFTYGRPM